MGSKIALLLPDSGEFVNVRTWNSGGLGEGVANVRLWNVNRPPVEARNLRQWNVLAGLVVRNVRLWNAGASLRVGNVRLWNVLTGGADPDEGVQVGGSGAASTLDADADAGESEILLVDGSGVQPGDVLSIGGELITVIAVVGDLVQLASPLVRDHAAGTAVSSVTGFVLGMMVFDKAGQSLGIMPAGTYDISQSPSRVINGSGSMQFFVPSKIADDGLPNPSIGLIADDRLIALAASAGMPTWAGAMELQDHGDGMVQVNVLDVTDLWTDVPFEIEQELADGTPATSVYAKVVSLLNAEKAKDGELGLLTDFAGSAPYFGDLELSGDAIDMLNAIADRTQTEWVWQASIDGDRLVVTLVVRDEFVASAGVDLTDGPGGNVTAVPRYTRDPSPIRHELRLTGRTTNIASYAPEWAQWAVKEIQPIVTRRVAPGDRRRRVEDEVTVDWSLSKAQQRALAAQVVDRLRLMFEHFLHAFHDQEGRPYHEGWQYRGAPHEIDQFIHTGLDWRTRRLLITFGNSTPGSIVMMADLQRQALIVLYDRVTGIQTVRRAWFYEAQEFQHVQLMQIHGKAWVYDVEGGVIVSRDQTNFDHSSAITGPAVTFMWPQTDGAVKYKTLKRIISITETGAATEGQYHDMDPAVGPTTGPSYTRPTIGDAPYKRWVAQKVVSSVHVTPERIWSFERQRIPDWDPRRDGVGAQLNRESVQNNVLSTSLRWHIVPWGVGVEGITSLSQGISAAATTLTVDSALVLPTLPGYVATLGRDLAVEDVLVTAVHGTTLTVVRARNGTTAIVHESGTDFTVKKELGDEEEWQGFELPYTWPEGEAWADRLLEKLSRPFERLVLEVTNENDDWSTIAYGSIHDVSLTTLGPVGGLQGQVRVLGWAPDYGEGRLEVVVEVLP